MLAVGEYLRSLPRKKKSISLRLKPVTEELLKEDPELESRPTFLFFKGAANGLFADWGGRVKPWCRCF